MQLVRPAVEYLASYRAALERGWSPNTMNPVAGRVELERIEVDPVAFLASQDDPNGSGEPITLPDGSVMPRLPGYRRWIWDDDFAGVIGVRWQPGTATLPPHVLGHIGYAVVPWQRRRGLATAALRELLPEIPELGLPYVDITTDVDNLASQKVITANGGVLVERFTKPAAYGPDSPALRWRIELIEQGVGASVSRSSAGLPKGAVVTPGGWISDWGDGSPWLGSRWRWCGLVRRRGLVRGRGAPCSGRV